MGGAELGQLGLGRLGAGLELIDLLEEAGQEPGGVAADLAVAEREVVEAVEQGRQALGRAEDFEEGVEAGGGGPLAEQALGQLAPGADPELLVGSLQERFDAPAEPSGSCLRRGEDQDLSRIEPVAGKPREAPRQGLRLAGPRGAEQEQGPVAVLDGLLLCLGESEHAPTLASARPP